MNVSREERELEERLVELLYGELAPEEEAVLRERLAEHPAAAERLRRWEALRQAVETLPEVEPDPAVHYALMRAARREVEEAPEKRGFFAWLDKVSLLPALAGVGVAVLAVSTLYFVQQDGFQDTAVPATTPRAPAASAPQGEAPATAVVAADGEEKVAAAEAPPPAAEPPPAARPPAEPPPAVPSDAPVAVPAKDEAPAPEGTAEVENAKPEEKPRLAAADPLPSKAKGLSRDADKRGMGSASLDDLDSAGADRKRAPAARPRPSKKTAAPKLALDEAQAVAPSPEARRDFAPPPPSAAPAANYAADDELQAEPEPMPVARPSAPQPSPAPPPAPPARERAARAKGDAFEAEAAEPPPQQQPATRQLAAEEADDLAADGAAVGSAAAGRGPGAGGDGAVAILARARAARSSGDLRSAVRDYEEFIRQYPGHSAFTQALFETAQSYERLGDVARAVQLYRLVVKNGGGLATAARARIDALDADLAPAEAAPAPASRD